MTTSFSLGFLLRMFCVVSGQNSDPMCLALDHLQRTPASLFLLFSPGVDIIPLHLGGVYLGFLLFVCFQCFLFEVFLLLLLFSLCFDDIF